MRTTATTTGMAARAADPRDRGSVVPLVGVVLAGGLSRRMGRDKALLPLRGQAGRTLLAQAVEKLSALCPEVWVSCGSGRSYAGFSCVPDAAFTAAAGCGGPLPEHLLSMKESGLGPLAGLTTCLARARAQGWAGMLTLPCDMPQLPDALLRGLVSAAAARERALAVFYRTPGGWEEPLAGVYRCGALPFLERALLAGQRRVRDILPDDARLLVPLPEAAHSLFANCNTPEQARALGVDVPAEGNGPAASSASAGQGAAETEMTGSA